MTCLLQQMAMIRPLHLQKKWHPRLRIQILCRRVREALLADFYD